MNLLGQGDQIIIDYMPYIPPMQLENLINSITDTDKLINAKNVILSHFFSLNKHNRSLARRLKSLDEQVNKKKKRAKNVLTDATLQDVVSVEGFDKT